MKLQNNLYHIVEQNDGNFRIALDAGCTIYKAHFPEQPVTPGVCIIQIAGELPEISQPCGIELKEVVNAKFLSVINPPETKEVVYNFAKITTDGINHTLKVSVTVTSGSTICAKLSLLYNIND